MISELRRSYSSPDRSDDICGVWQDQVTAAFYDQLAPYYMSLYADWKASAILGKLEQLLKAAGFQQVLTLRERFFQPVLVGLK